MKKKRFYLFSLLVVLMSFLSVNTTIFAESINAVTSTNLSDIKKGEEVVVSLSLNEYKDIKKGIAAYKATLNYDTNVFEQVQTDDFVSQDNWEKLLYNKNTNEFVAINKAGAKEDGEIVTIKLTAKQDIKARKTTISFNDIVASEGKKDIVIDGKDASSVINVIEEQQTLPPKQPDVDNSQDSQKPNKPQSSGSIPNTGLNDNYMYVIIGVEVVLLLAVLFFLNKKKIAKNIKNKQRVIISIFAVGLISLQLGGMIYANSQKGDIDENSTIDYKDITILQQHLINYKLIQEDKQYIVDMNSDGKLTVTDLALLVQKIEDKLDYQVDIQSNMDKFYFEKNEPVQFMFFANVSYDAYITNVTINDETYEVKRQEDLNIYEIELKAPDVSGVKTYSISEVKLNNGKTIKTDFKEKIEVLKDVPVLEGYKTEDLINESKIKVSFNLIDDDNAFQNGGMTLYDDSDNSVKDFEVKKGLNEFLIDVTEDKDYKLLLNVSYNRDTDALEDHEQDNSGNFTKDYPLKLVIDYNFIANNFKSYNLEYNEVNIFEKNQEIILGFDSSNNTNYKPQEVMVNDKYYTVEEKDGRFYAKIDSFKEMGNKSLLIKEVKLSNGKVFELNTDNSINVVIQKEKPSISDLSFVESVEDNSIKLSFNVIDNDKALQSLKYIIKDDKDNVIKEQIVDKENVSDTIKLENVLTSAYSVKIIADYSLIEGNPVVSEELYSEQFTAKTKVNVLNTQLSNVTLEKDDVLEITYDIVSNKQATVSKLVVDNKEVPVIELGNNQYKVQIRVGNVAGEKDIILSKVIFSDNEQVVVNSTSKIEVLKSILQVDNYQVKDDYNNSKVIFDFDLTDKDNAFVSGKVQLVKSSDNSVWKEEDITSAGKNHFELDVKELEEYTFKVIVKYNRNLSGSIAEEKVIFESPIQMIVDYNLNINNLHALSQQDEVYNYFNRNDDIKIRFESTNSTKFLPQKAVINGAEYELNNISENNYETTIKGFDTQGVKDIKIEKIIMNNTKELDVVNNNVVKVEVLKNAPTVENFEYNNIDDNKLNISFDVIDNEKSFVSGKVVVSDNEKEIYSTQIITGKNNYSVDLNTNEDYIVKVYVDYDLDSNALSQGDNEYKDIEVLNNQITIAQELIELKDVKSVDLYTKNGDRVEIITEIDVNSFNPQDYIAKVNMKDLPELYCEIEDSKVTDNGEFRLVLKYNNAVQYENGNRRNTIEVKFGEVDGNVASSITFEKLINIIKEDPNATIKLTSDLDATNISTNTYLGDFSGVIDGNGHTIRNLSKPLFNNLNGATIKNLIIKDASLKTGQGIIANTAKNTTIDNVHLSNSRIDIWNDSGTGGFIGKGENQTKIMNCSANDIFVKSNKRIGGIAGIYSESSVSNTYIKGVVTAGYDAAGGMLGQVYNSVIENSYADIQFNGTVEWATGGLVGYTSGSGVTLKNNISLAVGEKGYKITDNKINSNSKNNYEIKETNLKPSNKGAAIKEIEISNITQEFLTDTMGWDSGIWNLENKNGENMPTLKNLDPQDSSNKLEEETTQNPDVYIPELKRLKSYGNYNSDNEIAYHNTYKLIPFYDAKFIVEYGNKIAQDELLNTKKLSMIIPYDQSGNMVVGLNTGNYNSISKIRLVFEDRQTKDYTVSFKKKLNDVSVYDINDLGISYTYNQFILNKDIDTVNRIVQDVVSMDYKTQIAYVTFEEESRLYVDYYNDSVKSRIDQVVLSILSNSPEYNIYLDNDILKTKIYQDITEKYQLEKIIYSYNYFDKWYGMEIGGVKLSDIIFLSARNVNPDISINTLVNATMTNNRNTGSTVAFYNNAIKSKMGNMDLSTFLESYIQILTDYDNGRDWFTDNFKGELREKGIETKENSIKYRAWDLLAVRNHLLLPVLTAPQEDMYLIAVPTQLMIGSMNRYGQHIAGNHDQMDRMLDKYSDMIGNFYNTSLTFINNSEQILKSKVHIQYDTRFNFPQGAPTPGKQEPGVTQDPVMKWVYEAVGSWPADNGTGAYANGTDVYWVAYLAVGEEFTFKIFTHETAHNQDGYYFYEGNGRRAGTDGEDHADSNIEQNISDGSVVFNLRGDLAPTSDVSNNLTLDRINSPEEIHSYYKEMYETYYVLDYLTGKAFLQLTPEQQAQVAVKVSYNNSTDYDKGGSATTYSKISAEEFRNMNLQTIEDLWDNGIALRAPGTVPAQGSYGGDTHYSIYWYQPHNDNGRTNSYSFKLLGFEMLGVGGYSDGYVTFRSTKSKNDLDALRQITKDPTNTWKKYKMDRYDTVEKNLDNIKFFDTDKVIEAYKTALEADAKNGNRNNTNNLRRVLYGVVKRATKDFTTGSIYNQGQVVQISSAEELINAINNDVWGSYELTKDIDFSSVQPQDLSYINKEFVGRLNGNGYKITGLKATLFEKITYAEIQNLVIENPVYTSASKAIIANSSKDSLIYNVKVNNTNSNIPFVDAKQGSLQIIGDCNISVTTNEIASVEDLIKIAQSDDPLTNKLNYKLVANIDASSINNGDSIIKNKFTGELDGNGYTISNLNKPLFNELSGTVKNLTIDGMNYNNKGVSNIGAIARNGNGAIVDKVTLKDININAREQLGGVFGYSTNSKITRVTGTNINITVDRYYAGSIIGRASGADIIKDCVMSGTLNLTATHNGGIVGAMQWGGTIENVYANININRSWVSDSRNKNGGIFGALENDRPTSVKNCVVTGNMEQSIYKVASGINDWDKGVIEKYISNVYELQNTYGISNIYEGKDNVKSVDEQTLETESFYKDVLNWSEDIWDFSGVANGELPKIK